MGKTKYNQYYVCRIPGWRKLKVLYEGVLMMWLCFQDSFQDLEIASRRINFQKQTQDEVHYTTSKFLHFLH